jgi:hypothetical protein
VKTRYPILAILLLAAFLANNVYAHSPAADMADAAKNFLAALTPEQKAKAMFEFNDNERVNFNFVPMPRKGLPVVEMTSAQRQLAYVLLNSALSHRGYFKALTIMSLDQILYDMENQAPRRNPDLYYFSVFGEPGKDVWGYRVEGHHLALNFAAKGDTVIASTPSFLGSNPAEVRTGPRTGLRVLGQEDDLGRKLVTSLDEKQKSTAIYATEAPPDVITGNKRKVSRLEPLGLSASKMNREQRVVLTGLIKEYLGRLRPELADADWAKIEKAGWDKVHFAWAGPTEPGKGHYYRVQSATFLFEYDNTQNNANHVHAVWRDFENDFGDDVLKRHYEQTPHGK